LKGTSSFDKIYEWIRKEIKKRNFISGWIKAESSSDEKHISSYAHGLAEQNRVSGYKNDTTGININFLPAKIMQKNEIYK
jgi:hypothetical protein